MTGLSCEIFKKRKNVHQIKDELFQELSKETGKDDTELRNSAAKFDRQDAAVQLQLGAPQRRAAVETKDERGKPEVRNPDKTRGVKLYSYPRTKRSEQCSLPGEPVPCRTSGEVHPLTKMLHWRATR